MLKEPSFTKSSREAFSTIEALLAVAVFSLIVTASIGALVYGEESTRLAGNRVRAALLAEEGVEAVRNIRDAGFANLADGVYGLAISGSQWTFSGSQDTSDIFTRTTAVSSVDASRKQVTSTVSWQQNLQRTASLSTSTTLTNWMAIGLGDWSNPTQIASVAAPSGVLKRVILSGNYAYVAKSDTTVYVFDISNPSAPVQVSSITVSGSSAILALAVSGNRLYIGGNPVELTVVDISNPTNPSILGSLDFSGSIRSLAVSGTTVYLGNNVLVSAPEFYVVDASNPGSMTILGSKEMGLVVRRVSLSGSFAYILAAGGLGTKRLYVVDISNPATLPFVGTYFSLPSDPAAIKIFQTVAFVAGTDLTSGSEISLDISNPAAITLLNSSALPGSSRDAVYFWGSDIDTTGKYLFLGTSISSGELRIFDVSNPNALNPLAAVDLPNIAYDVAYDAVRDRLFVVDGQDLVVFKPQ